MGVTWTLYDMLTSIDVKFPSILPSVQVKEGGPKILPKSQEKLEIHVHNMKKYSQLLPCRHPSFTDVMFSGKQTTARKMVDQLKNC